MICDPGTEVPGWLLIVCSSLSRSLDNRPTMTSIQILLLAALCVFAVYRQSRRAKVIGAARFKRGGHP
jgi:hypothetical protein